MIADSTFSYFRYWAKTDKETGAYHLLPYHCLDVAAVASVWWDNSHAIRRSFNQDNLFDETQNKAWVLFFVALHDYGKFDVRFQRRAEYVWSLLYPDSGNYQLLPSVSECRNYYHGEGGLSWLRRDQEELFGCNSSNQGFDFLDDPEDSTSPLWCAWKPWIEAVTGHHGYIKLSEIVGNASLPPTCDKRLWHVDQDARREWIAALEKMFLNPVGLSLSDKPPACSPLFLAGFCSIADWLGSHNDEANFIFIQTPQDLSQYFHERCRADAKQILESAGVICQPLPYGGVVSLLGFNRQPRSMQTVVDDLPIQPGLSIIEAPTGCGKTEAALAYAWRLIAAGLADSIIFALPSQATANAMLDRLERIAPLLFTDHPNLLLAHGSARFNKAFLRIKHAALDGYGHEDGSIQCSQWLAESRKRIFLGQVGVCTVDQVLISVLPVRHRFVRGFGIGRSVLIVDEVHAYDAYMYGLLEEVLKEQKAAGGSAILLSATLAESQRIQLFTAWDMPLQKINQPAPYPLLMWTDGRNHLAFELSPSHFPKDYQIEVEPISLPGMLPDEALLRRMVNAAQAGAQVAFVCNLVVAAQALTRKLREMTSLPVDLFHARFCFSHRREKETAAKECFGPQGKRSAGRILIATQVVEQSLDLDFDWIITQLCPVDLLFQRMGRLHRHNHLHRPSGFEKPCCTVLLPEDGTYGVHEKIYNNTRVLWRTEQKVRNTPEGIIVFPDAYRSWIEAVYQDDPWDEEPLEQTAAFEAFKDNIEYIKRFLAKQMLERAHGMTPFSDTEDAVTAVTRDGDMNLTVIPYYRTQQGTVLMDGVLLESLDEFGQLEALALNSVGIPKSWGYHLEDPIDGTIWLAMEPEGNGFRGHSKGAIFRYHHDIGLEKEKER